MRVVEFRLTCSLGLLIANCPQIVLSGDVGFHCQDQGDFNHYGTQNLGN